MEELKGSQAQGNTTGAGRGHLTSWDHDSTRTWTDDCHPKTFTDHSQTLRQEHGPNGGRRWGHGKAQKWGNRSPPYL